MGTHPIFESDFDCLTEMGVRRDWYQSNEKIILALLIKGTSDVTVEFLDQSFSCSGLDKDGNKFTEEINLALPINPKESTFKVTGSKIEFKLKKATEGLRWEVLENDAPIETTPKPHNSSKDWDKIGKEADEEYKKRCRRRWWRSCPSTDVQEYLCQRKCRDTARYDEVFPREQRHSPVNELE